MVPGSRPGGRHQMETEVGAPTLMMRVYFSSYHLWAAEHFSQLTGEIEGRHKGKPRFDIQHRSYSVNAVLSSVAFLEAAVNELFQDAADNHESYIQPRIQYGSLDDYSLESHRRA